MKNVIVPIPFVILLIDTNQFVKIIESVSGV